MTVVRRTPYRNTVQNSHLRRKVTTLNILYRTLPYSLCIRNPRNVVFNPALSRIPGTPGNICALTAVILQDFQPSSAPATAINEREHHKRERESHHAVCMWLAWRSLFSCTTPLLPIPPKMFLPLPLLHLTTICLGGLLVWVLERADGAAWVRAALVRDLVYHSTCPTCSSVSCWAALGSVGASCCSFRFAQLSRSWKRCVRPAKTSSLGQPVLLLLGQEGGGERPGGQSPQIIPIPHNPAGSIKF
jgi:hypothetical protein